MDYAVKNIPSAAPIIEIGSFCGLSANVITYLKERHGMKNPLITCDKWIFEGAEDSDIPVGDSLHVTHGEYKRFVKETFLRNVRTFSRYDLPFTVELLSDEFFISWETSQKCEDVFGREVKLGGPISFCYIDGNHSYDFAKRDFENCDRYLEKGGFILFDDSADASGWEVCKVVREVKATGRYDLVSRDPNYFFTKK
jgi:predicted O-methyltransferase YrrM